MNEALLDVNILIAGVVENHLHHHRAQKFLSGLDRFYTTPTTQGGFLRFLTRPWKNPRKEEQPPRMTVAGALAVLSEVTNSSKHVFLPDDESYTNVSLLSMSGHRQWTDAYLIRLSLAHGLRLATLERKLDNMDDPASPVLLIVAED
jgi:toxin-antitoxin system PIN domain toxin